LTIAHHMTISYSIEPQAAIRFYDHGYKHPDQAVFGVLLGTESKGSIDVKKSIAVSHGIPLNIFVETALTQIEEFAKTIGEQIVGCYYLNETGTPSVPQSVVPILEAFKHHSTNCITLTVDLAKSVSTATSTMQLKGYTLDFKSVKEVPTSQLSFRGEIPVTGKYTSTNDVHDFFDHMEDISLRWLQ